MESTAIPRGYSSFSQEYASTPQGYPPTMSDPAKADSKIWQTRLEVLCDQAKLSPPAFQMYSDRRGGRTAWSSKVTVYGTTLSARFWYDGKNINNAKEDAAECALNWLNKLSKSSPKKDKKER